METTSSTTEISDKSNYIIEIKDNYIIDGLISCLKHDDISALSVDEQYKIYHNGELVEPAFSKVIIAVCIAEAVLAPEGSYQSYLEKYLSQEMPFFSYINQNPDLFEFLQTDLEKLESGNFAMKYGSYVNCLVNINNNSFALPEQKSQDDFEVLQDVMADKEIDFTAKLSKVREMMGSSGQESGLFSIIAYTTVDNACYILKKEAIDIATKDLPLIVSLIKYRSKEEVYQYFSDYVKQHLDADEDVRYSIVNAVDKFSADPELFEPVEVAGDSEDL